MSRKEFETLDNKVLSIAKKRERLLRRPYQDSLNEIRSYFSGMVDRFGNADGTIDYSELNKRGRFEAGRRNIAAQTDFIYEQMLEDIKLDLREVYELSYNTTTGVIERITGSAPAGKLRLDVLDRVINSPSGGLTIDLRMEQLQLDLTNRLTSSVTRGVAQGKKWSQIATDLRQDMEGNLSSIQRIVRTEGHRIEETAKFETAKKSRKKLKKEWVSERDSAVRDGHRLLDGTIIELDELFVSTYGGQGEYPGNMGTAEDDINCRCFLNYVSDDEEV